MASSRREAGAAAQPGARTLVGAALLAAAGALWAGFQWLQLGVARRGGDPFCALGSGDACADLGDSGFARAIEGATGLPVAAWGVVWSVAALALPLLALQRLRRGRPPEPLWSATLLAAVAGVGGVALLAGISLREGLLCGNCAITYALVLAYAGLVLFRARRAPPTRLAAGTSLAAAGVAAGFAILLPLALRSAEGDAASELLAVSNPSAPELARRIAALSPEQRQYLSNARGMWARPARSVPSRPPRALDGSPMAPVRITQFVDLMCSHCANLHEELEQLRASVPPNSISIESRKFPLHASCNPYVPPGGDGLRCLAALALICLERHPQAFEVEGQVLRNQAALSRDLLFRVTEPYMPRAALERCMASPETRAKLDEDIAWAAEHGIEGTPMVLVNGRKTLPYLPFLYAMALTGGDADHAAFQGLPAPDAAPHSH